MSDKLFLVEISSVGAPIVAAGKVLVQAPSAVAAKRIALDAALEARKVGALEVLSLSAAGVGVLAEAKTVEPEAAAAG